MFRLRMLKEIHKNKKSTMNQCIEVLGDQYEIELELLNEINLVK
jgi:hypothetical protein